MKTTDCFRLFLISSLTVFGLSSAQATTLWAAKGASLTEAGDTLVAQIRDDLPAPQSYMEIKEGGSYAFKGLFAGAKQRFQMGVNEKGLFIGTATAGSVALATRRYLMQRRFIDTDGHFSNEWIIRHCASVEEAIKNIKVFQGYPMSFILADASEIALVEVTPGKAVSIRRSPNGTMMQTNHYTAKSTARFNEKIGESSKARFLKIQSLLSGAPKPLTAAQFIEMTKNDSDGPDMSLFRVGSKPQSPKTLSTIVVKIPKGKPAQIYVRYLPNPSYNMTRWKTVQESYPRH